jgi:glycine/D-amino acid oxidase-like deaminating enzyme
MPGMRRRTFLGAALAAPIAARMRADAAEQRSRDHLAADLQVVVIGAGAFGGWTALELARRGARVTLADGWGPGNSRASSGGETRVIRAAYADLLYTRMAQRALALWRENERVFGQALFRRTGVLFMAQRASMDFLMVAMRNLEALSVEHEVLDVDELERRYPQVRLEGIERALFEPESGCLLARRACAAVTDALVAEGGRYLRQHGRPGAIANGAMTGVHLDDGSVLTADAFVFASGPWLGTLFPGVLGRLITVPRQEVLFFGTPPGEHRYDEGQFPIWADFGERLWYGIPGNENRGFKIADGTPGPSFDPTTGDRTVSEAGVRAARDYMARRFPALARAPLVESRVCQYPLTSDGNFIVDRHPEAANVWLVGGGGDHGYKHGPALGEHAALRVLGEIEAEPKFLLARFPDTRSS